MEDGLSINAKHRHPESRDAPCARLKTMRRLIVSLVAIGAGLVALGSAGAAPPDDLAAYCRATYGAVQHQVRCLYTERAARERLGRRQVAVDPETWSQCQGRAGSWTAVENCVAQPAAGGAGPAGGAGGGQEQRRGAADSAAVTPGARTPTPATPSPAGSQPPVVTGSPSTVILGPRQAGTVEANRPMRAVSEAEAERQLKGVLERSGESSARCTKKQYGPGWVTVCE
jgi:hypothetical protein